MIVGIGGVQADEFAKFFVQVLRLSGKQPDVRRAKLDGTTKFSKSDVGAVFVFAPIDAQEAEFIKRSSWLPTKIVWAQAGTSNVAWADRVVACPDLHCLDRQAETVAHELGLI